MAKRRRRRVKSIPLTIGNDPAPWRFNSLQEALAANTDIISELIRAGQIAVQQEESNVDRGVSDEGTDQLAAR